MTIHESLNAACAAVGIVVPRFTKPGEWVRCPVSGKPSSNRSGAVLLFDDGAGGIAWNHISGNNQRFAVDGLAGERAQAPLRDIEAERRMAAEQAEVARICAGIVRAAQQGLHPYLAAKGFPDEHGLVLESIAPLIPDHQLGEDMALRLPDGEGPWLIVPGRIGDKIATVQIIGPDGAKKNIYRGKMKGAAHRIATGRETWVCEGIATALSVRAALRLLGRSATVLSAFSASNVAAVAKAIPEAIVAADHDRPIPELHDNGTGEFYAIQSGCLWVMPPEMGDFNDMHQSDGLRAVAVHLRGIGRG